VGGVAVVEAGRDEQLPGLAGGCGGLGRVDRGTCGLIEFDGHDHARQDDRLGDKQDGNSDGRCCGVRHPYLQS